MRIFGFALLIRLAFIFWHGPITHDDTADYFRLAENLRHHLVFSLDVNEPFEPTILRAPLYPALVSTLYWTREAGPTAIAVVQAILDALVCLCLFCLGRTVVTRRWALAAAIMYALHPGAIVTSATLLTESIFGSLCVFGVFFIVKGLDRGRLALLILGGVTLGLAALTRSSGAAFPILFAVAIWITCRNSRRLLQAAAIAGSSLLVVAPWVIRCSLLAGEFVLIQAPGFGLNFYYPTRVDWDQKDQAAMWASFFTQDPCGKILTAAETPAQMAAAGRLCVDQGLRNIREAPIRYALLRLRALPQLFITSFDSFTGFNFRFSAAWETRRYGILASKLLLLLVFSLFPFILALRGAAQAGKNIVLTLSAAACGFVLLIHVPMWIEYRYWEPVVPFLMLLAARGAETLSGMVPKQATN